MIQDIQQRNYDIGTTRYGVIWQSIVVYEELLRRIFFICTRFVFYLPLFSLDLLERFEQIALNFANYLLVGDFVCVIFLIFIITKQREYDTRWLLYGNIHECEFVL